MNMMGVVHWNFVDILIFLVVRVTIIIHLRETFLVDVLRTQGTLHIHCKHVLLWCILFVNCR